MRDLLLIKVASIEKCLDRIQQKRIDKNFDLSNYDTQDIIVLNLQRAVQQSIDIAMYICAEMKLGLPENSADSFKKLQEKTVISTESFHNMRSMIGFRNIAIHEYQKIDYDIVNHILVVRLNDFYLFNKEILEYFK